MPLDYPNIYRKTKIVCTIGPASNTVAMLVALINAGMNVARLNFSHGAHEEHLQNIRNVREAARLTGRQLAILQDLGGPKIRTGLLKNKTVELKNGERITITTQDILGDERRISMTYKNLPKDIKPGDRILIDDGLIELSVLTASGTEVQCEIRDGGTLKEKKGMNLPDTVVGVPSLTDKDILDLEFGLDNDVDYVALSFVRSAQDIATLKERIGAKGKTTPVVAKIEKPEAIKEFAAILQETDAVMVARGDLGVELPSEEVPMLQKMIIEQCNCVGKPVITATQMLESMIENQLPTRAESTDVANAVLDGTDAVMLSGETSVGQYPVEAVQMMDKIVKQAEASRRRKIVDIEQPSDITLHTTDAIAHAACVLAEKIGGSAIVALTTSGTTAMMVAKYRPMTKIIGATDNPATVRALSLVWGVRGLLVDSLSDTDTTFDGLKRFVLQSGFVNRGDMVVFTGSIPVMKRGRTNMVKVERIE
jgi:pyruvate kinase